MSKGSLTNTAENDYQAEDGLWYPSTELDSYFKEKKYFYPSITSGLEVLKELYGDSLAAQVYNTNPLLKRISNE